MHKQDPVKFVEIFQLVSQEIGTDAATLLAKECAEEVARLLSENPGFEGFNDLSKEADIMALAGRIPIGKTIPIILMLQKIFAKRKTPIEKEERWHFFNPNNIPRC